MTEINIALPTFEQEDFEQKVIDAAARQLLTRYTGDEDGNPVAVPTELQRKLRDHMEQILKEQAEKFAPIVAATILDEGIPQTNNWGDPSGKTRPLKTVIADEVKKNLTHHNGKRGEGVLALLIREEIEKQLRAQLQQIVDQAREPILAAMREEATAVFERAMTKALPALNF